MKVRTLNSFYKLILIAVSITFSISANAGKLADCFNQFASLDCVQASDAPSDLKEQFGADNGKIIIPFAGPTMMKYPVEFTRFHNNLPSSLRLNKGELEEGEPEIYFSQEDATSKAEVIIIMYGENGLNVVSFLTLPPKVGVQFKQDAIKQVGK